MKSILYPLILILTIIVGCGNKTIQSHKKNNPIAIDGNGQDWAGVPLEYNEDMKMIYGVTNDDSSLNLMVRFSDKHLVRMLQSRGVTLWFNEQDNEDNKFGIYYIDKKRTQMEFMQGRNLRSQPDEGFQKKLLLTGHFFVIKQDTVPIEQIDQIEAAADNIDGLYCFEFRIPLISEGAYAYSLSYPDNDEIDTVVEIAAADKNTREKMKSQMEKQMPGTGMPKGGRRGREAAGLGGKRNRNRPDFDKKEIHFTIKLDQM